jgi:diadenosine tetraphosphatase ApaH/serine/threonine PP2A family protein phosphatase
MRYLVLTDIHANLEALDACLADATPRGYDRSLVLGDLVGYGADPNAVIACIQTLNPVAIVRGNHDKVACGLEQAESFNAVAKAAVQWTLEVLTPAHREWLASLPQGPTTVDEAIEICHGSPFDEDAYIFDELDAVHALKTSVRALCLFGHTHCPAVFRLLEGKFEGLDAVGGANIQVPLREAAKYLVNPGSVGQPRDGDPRAAYAIADTKARRVDLFRIGYAVQDAQAKVVKAGLPEVLAHRLGVGR